MYTLYRAVWRCFSCIALEGLDPTRVRCIPLYTAKWPMPIGHWRQWPMGIGHCCCINRIHRTRVGSRPSRAIQLKQRYTVYSYTALYTMQPLHHPSAPAAAGRAPPGRRARAVRARGSRASSPRSLPASPKPAAPQTAARRGRRTAPASAPTPAGSRRSS